MQAMASDALVIVPTYNERENITAFLNKVLGLPYPLEILVVDDGSPDGTQDLVRQVMDQHPGRVHLLPRTAKMGLGTAYIAGFRWGLTRSYQYFFEIDADFSHNPEDLLRLLAACREHAIALVVVGPEDPLVLGIHDFFLNDPQLSSVGVIGPQKEAATLEGSKAYAKSL